METGVWLSQLRKEVLPAPGGRRPGCRSTWNSARDSHLWTHAQRSAPLRPRSPALAGEAVSCKVQLLGGSGALPMRPASQQACGSGEQREPMEPCSAGPEFTAQRGVRTPAKNRVMTTACHVRFIRFSVTAPSSKVTLPGLNPSFPAPAGPMSRLRAGSRRKWDGVGYLHDSVPGKIKSLFCSEWRPPLNSHVKAQPPNGAMLETEPLGGNWGSMRP